ncbi:hypothetical protein [Dactylosporangium salmoneum]|uniref:Uncharacterized protein n=1 Tax=Dactylosporangium salmoneum TaxID=53361 RepID=A0ABP5SFX6_9ACTN
MREMAGDPAALERLRVQRSRLADRMRPPWWYLTGGAVLWALVFAVPFISRYLPRVGLWPFVVAGFALAGLLQWGLVRATGISVGIPDLTYRPGRPARIAMLVLSLAVLVTEHYLIGRGLLVAAAVLAAVAVGAGVVSVQATLRGIRHHLRVGGGAA